ncbi:uncharacterized protein LOC129241380 [Anastrepha obliqua]|uniref:uncharacterized protein LOC129241380 n=1 Tax=Anastrepha obliqua TaxID=95512 RepID=UPI00240A618D|nr:uncharacterized protein LOC129241380 [Anastrepha obliqua]
MDWPRRSYALALLTLLPFVHCWSTTTLGGAGGQANVVGAGAGAGAIGAGNTGATTARAQSTNEVSPYIDLVLCPMREQPWGCARQKSARILDLWDNDLQMQWQKLKVEADRQLNATIEKRGYSASEVLTREKPSTILKKIEIGTSYMKKYLAETMDGFLGREYDYVQTDPKQNLVTTDEDDDDNNEEEEDSDTEYEEDDDEEGNETDAESETVQQGEEDYTDRDEVASQHIASLQGRPAAVNGQLDHSEVPLLIGTAPAEANHDASAGVEFIEIEDNENAPTGQLKKPGGGGSKKKRKNKKKKKPETLLVVQPAELELHGHGGHHGWDVHGHGGQHDEVVEWVPVTQGHSKPSKKQKRKKKKKHQHADDSVSVVVEQEPSDHLGLGLLEELADAVDVVDLDEGHKRKHKKPHKYGRSVGVTRGKKKKKKKALAKLVLLGSFLKAKIELLLKILGAHLQIKFFAIALIGLLINIARFWIDVKRGGTPQKVVYVEHAHHQHHYDEHNEDWGGESGGSYWKRSLQTDPSLEEAATDSYQPVPQNQDPHFMAYGRQWQ